jgi:S1-C subfamily serine protease
MHVMCSRVYKGMVLLAALVLAMAVGAVIGGGAVYLLTQNDDARPVVEVRAGDLDPRRGFPPILPHGIPVWGAIVVEVVQDSPASRAGLEEGVAIAALDDEPILGPEALVAMIAERDPGDEVELTVYWLAGRAKRSVEVTLGEHPDKEGTAYLGVWLDGDAFEFDGDFWGE